MDHQYLQLKKQRLNQIIFYVLHIIFVLISLPASLFLAYGAMRGYGFPGIIFAIPPIVILAQTVPHLAILSKQPRALLAQAIASLPPIIGTILIFVALETVSKSPSFLHLSLAMLDIFLYLSIFTVIILISSIAAYLLFKQAITTPEPLYTPPAPARLSTSDIHKNPNKCPLMSIGITSKDKSYRTLSLPPGSQV